MLFVLDASAIIAFLRSERGADRIEEVLADPDNVCLAHSINLCEVFYDFHRAARVDRAIAVMADLTAAGVQEDSRLDRAFWQDAGAIKSVYRRVSLADCLCVALARSRQCVILSADRHELERLRDDGVCQIEFIR